MSPKTCQVWSRNRGARFAISREVSQRSGGPLSLPHSAPVSYTHLTLPTICSV